MFEDPDGLTSPGTAATYLQAQARQPRIYKPRHGSHVFTSPGTAATYLQAQGQLQAQEWPGICCLSRSKMEEKAVENEEWSEDGPPHVNIFYCMGE
jgi:hypothetical protein